MASTWRKGLHGNVAIVTGAASGIGRALSFELAARGAEVVLADRQEDASAEAASRIRGDGGKATAAALDVRDVRAFEDLVEDVVSRSGRVDLLFNNAGIAVGGEMAAYEDADWDDVIDVNLRGVANGIQAVYPYMIQRKSGHIVNTASVAGLITSPSMGSYTATKHAVVGITKALRVEAAKHGVRASVLCPGAIRTPILTGGRFGRSRYGNFRESDMMGFWEKLRPMNPADFAARALDAVAQNDAFIVIPRAYRALWWLERMSPALGLRLAALLAGQRWRQMEKLGVTFPVRKPRTREARRLELS